ncbi:MAG: hypothetical protein IK121_08340 [Lachnospiraceae bacterium]|nr:hypothetical protein [Lachnospiraceae bacterium]
MNEVREIPSSLMQKWEQEAIDQKIPYTEFGSFLKMKERNYWQSQSTTKERPIFANAARNKLTEYGQRVALDTLLSIPAVERCIKFARFDFEDLRKKLSDGFASEEQRQDFIFSRDTWFRNLKERMKDLRISKEVLESFGLNWKECKSFAYQTL